LALLLVITLAPGIAQAQATFGVVVGPLVQGGVNFLIGGASDLVLDEARGRLYLVNPSQRRIEVYSTTQRRFLSVVQTDALPISAAMSPDGRVLYVTAHEGAALNLIDLNTLALVTRVNLPARPEGVAVGADGRVLVTTIGTGANNLQNTLMLFNPASPAGVEPLRAISFAPPPSPSPILPAPAGRPAFANRTNLIASRNGQLIFGFVATGAPNANTRALFVYDVAAASVLRSRTVNETSTVLSISPDGSRAMAGLRLFDTQTLQVLGQQNAANLPYTLPAGSNFNVQQNQGGSVFSPDGRYIFSGFNFAPLQNPPARANISQLLLNDPDNLLTQIGLKLPENLAGNMVISSDGGTIYALSESGFLILPVGTLGANPIAVSDGVALLTANDQCGVTTDQRTATVAVRNAGGGRVTATAQLVPTVAGGAPAVVAPLPLPGGAGGGAPGGGVVVVVPPTVPGAAAGAAGQTRQQVAIAQTAPSVRATNNPLGSDITFTYNPANSRSPGTIAPHDFQIVSNEAVNIPAQVRIYQNQRDAEARAGVQAVPVGVSGNEGLTDMQLDSFRNRIYISNSGLNRVEVFDLRTRRFLAPIKVGQLPRSLALAPDGNTLYVANSGGESISIIDPDRLQVTGRVRFPALPFNSTAAVVTPSVIAATQRGLMIVMSNGSLWKLVGDEAVPRNISPVIGTATVPQPRTMTATPNGEFLLLLAGNGTAYLYDALVDEFVLSRQITTGPIQGYYGPVAAAPRGAYFLVNGFVLNQALTVVSAAPATSLPTRPGAVAATIPRPISAVAPVSATTYARFAASVQAAANALATDPPFVELVDANTGALRGAAVPALEGPLSTQVGTGRVNVNGRTMVVDPSGSPAYVLTVSGLSVVPLETAAAADRPLPNNNGTVNLASYTTAMAPNGLISIFGRNLAQTATARGTPWPNVLGGVCVTVGATAIPLSLASPSQINAHLPPNLATGRQAMTIRAVDRKSVSPAQQINVTRYAPAVLVDPETGQAAIYHEDGRPVNLQNPATRDQRLVLYAIGLGPVKGVSIGAGVPVPASPQGVTDTLKVFFDDPRYRESEMVVEASGPVPGLVGVYQVHLYVPGDRRRGDKLPVTLRIGGVDSPSSAPVLPYVTVR
jgi:uncharacterized protein (TIGR03437 family)